MNIKYGIVGIATAVGIVAASHAFAETVVISPDQRTMMQEYVVKEKIRPFRFKEKVVVGATLPEDVELAPVPEAWGPTLRSYHYAYSDDHFYFVEPSSRKVIHIE
jgi:hypothetical protein